MASTTPDPTFSLTAGQSALFGVVAAGVATLSAEIDDVVADAVEDVADSALRDFAMVRNPTRSVSVGGRPQAGTPTVTGPYAFKLEAKPQYADVALAGRIVTRAIFSFAIEHGAPVGPESELLLSDAEGTLTGTELSVIDTDLGATNTEFLSGKAIRLR